jgi:glucose-6-phosphate dehydrogenase assembly protein OpcA
MAQAVIDADRLRRRLDEIWTALGRDASAQDQEVMRACSLTLIAVVEAEHDPETVAQSLGELMRQHPSRTILVRLVAGSALLLEAEVEARCWRPYGDHQQICSEQIVVRCSEATLAEVPGAILPLLVPDLPVVLFCPSLRAWRSAAFGALAELAGRIIFDTFSAPQPLEALSDVQELRRLGRAQLSDLSWTRLSRWRALLAQVFENDLYRARLRNFSEAVVYYQGSNSRRVPPTCLLLGGWLVSRLHWTRDQIATGFRFEHRPADQPEGKLAAFELLSGDPAVRVRVSRCTSSSGEVVVEMKDLDPVMNRVSLAPSNLVLLLSEELSIRRPDLVFAESLDWAVRLGRQYSQS